MNSIEKTKEKIMKMVMDTKNHRIRPHELEKTLFHERGVSISIVKEALKDLVKLGRLVFTYRDPCSYVEIPVVEKH